MGQKKLRLGCAFGVVFHGWSALLCFEMLYRGFGFLVLFPLLGRLLSLLPGLVGEDYLGQANFLLIFRHPAAILLLLGVLLLAGLLIFFEITALFLYAEQGWRREPVSVRRLLQTAAARTASLLRPKRLPVFLLLPVMMLTVFSLLSGYLRTVTVPEFIMEYLKADRLRLALFATASVLCHLILLGYLFGFPALLASNRSFVASWRESRSLLRGRTLRTAGRLCAEFLAFELAMAALAAAGILLLYGGVRLSDPALSTARGQFRLSFLTLQGVWIVAAGALMSAFLCAAIVMHYHRLRADVRPERMPRRRALRPSALRAGAVLGTLVLLIAFSESELGGNGRLPENLPTRIVAHRAGAAFAPENTAAALNRAVSDGAAMAEIDVQQLGDGTLVVLHDTSFKRTTGTALDVWDADCETVRRLDAGSSFSGAFAGEPVPTLDSMLTAAKGRIDLMIELKSTGRERGLVRETLALLEAHGMKEQCVIASMDMDLLRQVKALDPKMETALISALLLSGEYNLKDLDAYSVETTALSLGLVLQAHLQGKQVYAWTANSEETMHKILRCGADGLVTDNPLLARYCIETAGENLLLEELTDLLFPAPAA